MALLFNLILIPVIFVVYAFPQENNYDRNLCFVYIKNKYYFMYIPFTGNLIFRSCDPQKKHPDFTKKMFIENISEFTSCNDAQMYSELFQLVRIKEIEHFVFVDYSVKKSILIDIMVDQLKFEPDLELEIMDYRNIYKIRYSSVVAKLKFCFPLAPTLRLNEHHFESTDYPDKLNYYQYKEAFHIGMLVESNYLNR